MVDHELNQMKHKSAVSADAAASNNNNNNNGEKDVQYLLKNLHPEKSTHLDVLLLIATTPENIFLTNQALEKEEEVKQKRREYLNPNAYASNASDGSAGASGTKSDNSDIGFDLDGDWGDEEEDDNVKANKARQEEKERLAKEVAAASGKTDNSMVKNIKIEGIDDGVLGQRWVEKTLSGE